MESILEKTCLEEISTLILDANQKVTLKTISNNWSVTNVVAKGVLSKWLDSHKSKSEKLVTEFLCRGVNGKGIQSISVVPEEMKMKLEKKWKNFAAWLYSVETRSNARKLDLPNNDPIIVKRILLSPAAPRDLHIPEIPTIKEEPIVMKQESKANTLFSMIKPAAEKKPEIKEFPKMEPKSPDKITETPIKVEATAKEIKPEKEVKVEKSSPEDTKPQAKAQAGKKMQLKNQKPVPKGSISSFFSSKPGTSKASEKLHEKPTIDIEMHPEVKAVKRALSPEDPPATKNESNKKKPLAKKIKLKEPTKRSRIRVMADSSDEEEEANDVEMEEPDAKFIKFDRESTPEREPSPVSVVESPEKPDAGKKNKSKRWVTKRYQTEDGFISTERVLEEYSASEGENDENRKKNSPPKPKEKVAKVKKSAEKKKPVPEVGKKQVNIMSFFHKK